MRRLDLERVKAQVARDSPEARPLRRRVTADAKKEMILT
jgi:hypothetical protein